MIRNQDVVKTNRPYEMKKSVLSLPVVLLLFVSCSQGSKEQVPKEGGKETKPVARADIEAQKENLKI